MSLLNEQRKRANTLQQVKELARAGQWVEAKKLVDTLPDTADVIRIRNGIEKQLFIATGEVPSVMENTYAVAEMDESVGTKPTAPPAPKAKRTADDIPSYMPIRIAGFLIYGAGVMAMTAAVLIFLISFTEESYYGDATRGNALVYFVGGFFTISSGGMMLMFVDIAKNTYVTNRLLSRLLDKSGEQ